MKKIVFALAAPLLALAGGAHAAYTQGFNSAVVFNAAPTPGQDVAQSTFINGVSSDFGSVNLGVFHDVVSDTGHAKTVFSFASNITAFGALWDLTVNNSSMPGSGLDIDIGNDGSVDFSLGTDQNGFWGVKSDTAFNKFSVAYTNVSPRQETYEFSALNFLPENGPTTLPPVGAIPEPETYAMMLAGLGALGAVSRRRKAR